MTIYLFPFVSGRGPNGARHRFAASACSCTDGEQPIVRGPGANRRRPDPDGAGTSGASPRASISNGQTRSGLRPAPPMALLSAPHPARASHRWVPVCSSPGAPAPPGLPGGDTRTSLSGNPLPARAARSSPAPGRGAGAVMAISGISRARERQRRRFPGREREDREELTRTRFSPGFSPCSGPWWR